jgi:hypothetical protein
VSKPTTWLDIYEAAGATVTAEGVSFNSADLKPFDIVLRVSLHQVISSHGEVRVELAAPDGTGLLLYPDQVRLLSKEAPDA